MITDREYLFKFNNIIREGDKIYRNAAKNAGLSDCAFWIIYTLREKGNLLTQSEICDLIYLPKQTVNSALKKLEGEGCIELKNGSDRRCKQVSLTGKGVLLAEKTVDQVIAQEEKTFARLSPDEKDTFLRLNRKYIDLLKANLQPLEGPPEQDAPLL